MADIWFGTKDYAQWVPAPAVSGYAAGASNWSSKVAFLNGGANVRRSFGSHREYAMTWNPKPAHKLTPIMDYASGMHGDGLLYWSDPFAEYTNVLPKDWATPMVGATDGVNISDPNLARPALVPSSAQQYGFPMYAAQFTGLTTAGGRRTLILVPPGKDFILRAYGSESGGTFRYYIKERDSAAVAVPWSSPTTMNALAPTRVSGGTNGTYVEVYLQASISTAIGTVIGAMAQIVDSGSTPLWERFISGQGNSGCRFDGTPSQTPYSAALDLVGMTANLVEVGAWL